MTLEELEEQVSQLQESKIPDLEERINRLERMIGLLEAATA